MHEISKILLQIVVLYAKFREICPTKHEFWCKILQISHAKTCFRHEILRELSKILHIWKQILAKICYQIRKFGPHGGQIVTQTRSQGAFRGPLGAFRDPLEGGPWSTPPGGRSGGVVFLINPY